MAEFAEFFVLFVAIFTLIFLVLFSVRFIRGKKKADYIESILEGLRCCSSDEEASAYLQSLSYDDLKIVCDWYGFDINNFIKKV